MPTPLVSLRHLERLTDDTGLLEHCLGKIPRRKEGYTTDDNARALWVCLEWLELAKGSGNRVFLDTLHRLADRYLAFLLWVQREDGTFQNNISFTRLPEEELPSDDCLGRSLWASAKSMVSFSDDGRRLAAEQIFALGLNAARDLSFPRGWAYALAACSLLVRHGVDKTAISKADIRKFVEQWEGKLVQAYSNASTNGWNWFEPAMTYGNGVLPWALFCSYPITGNSAALAAAKESLDFLIKKMTSPQGIIRPVGNRGWCKPGYRSDWDQQPLDVMKLALACKEAWQVLKEDAYLQIVYRCRSWFYGENDLQLPLANAEEGSCCDGLTEKGVNPNQGAESTLSYLLTEAIYYSVKKEVEAIDDGNRI